MNIQELTKKFVEGSFSTAIELSCWIRTNRQIGSIGFMEVNDGSMLANTQVVYNNNVNNFEQITKLDNGCAVKITGMIVATPQGKQSWEIQAQEIIVLGNCDEDYPLQKKRHSFEFLREIAHLRPRTNTFNALYRVRSRLSFAVHNYFQSQGYIYLHAPMITGNDGEGAGESFTITTRSDGNYQKDLFGKKATMTVTGQLHAEAFANGFKNIYTFGPVFRAERSNSPRHANEFWMIEPETSFTDLEGNIKNIEGVIKYLAADVLESCPEEIAFFNKMIDQGLIERLKMIRDSKFHKMTYTEGIKHLEQAKASGISFEYNNIFWGMDLQSEHEKYLCEKVIGGPVFLTDYPKEIKAFYMKLNPDNKTVAAVDLLVPKIGEIVGGSQREDRYDVLMQKMKDLKMETESLEWYLDLRRFGGVMHAGYGIGFDRLLMYFTGMENIRDTIPFPRTPGNLKY